MKPKLTAIDVVRAYSRCAGLSTKQPIDLLMETHPEKAARRAIIQAVARGLIEHDGDPLKGRLTKAGVDLVIANAEF